MRQINGGTGLWANHKETTRLLKEMWVKKKDPGNFFSKIIFLVTTDHENSFPKIRADPSWA